jgi:hypothetical protein
MQIQQYQNKWDVLRFLGKVGDFNSLLLIEEEMTSIIPLKLTPRILLMLAVLILGVGFGLGRFLGGRDLSEGFEGGLTGIPRCSKCNQDASSGL